MAFVYILYSKIIDGYYTGFTPGLVEERIHKHNSKFYKNKYTAKASDWTLYLKINCQSELQARKIELHIKKMKSRKYITDLKKYAEMTEALLKKYA